MAFFKCAPQFVEHARVLRRQRMLDSSVIHLQQRRQHLECSGLLAGLHDKNDCLRAGARSIAALDLTDRNGRVVAEPEYLANQFLDAVRPVAFSLAGLAKQTEHWVRPLQAR